MDPEFGQSAFTMNFSTPNAFVNEFPVIPVTSHPTASSSQLDVLARGNFYNLPGGTKRKFDALSLSLGNSSVKGSNKQIMRTCCTISSPKGSDDGSVDLGLNYFTLCNEGTSRLDKQANDHRRTFAKAGLDLELSLSVGPCESTITDSDLTAATEQNNTFLQTCIMDIVPTVDEGSTSLRRPTGDQVLSFLNKTAKMTGFSPRQVFLDSSNQTEGPASFPASLLQLQESRGICTSGSVSPQQRIISTKVCSHPGCIKGARGSSRRCIAHGGGRRCHKEDCNKGAEGKTIFCKAHGGGRRCENLGCTKSAEGRTDFCIAHGGGQRCIHEGCRRASRGKSGRCIKHGGGKRCQQENCSKSAEGRSGLCIAHGGGRRCQHDGCGKGSQGSTAFCKAHGGGKRCMHPNCTKGAEGSTPFCKGHGGGKRCSGHGCTKSVHGGTQFCVAHGGGKRCVVEGCTKSARGRTDRCVGHGGGKRCIYAGCDKSAQGSTDFCKAHGGGKRCLWGHPGSDLGVGGPPCDRLARGKNGMCVHHNPLLDDDRIHGGRTLGAFCVTNTSHDLGDCPSNAEISRDSILMHPVEACHVPVPVPESRVHGGNLVSMFANGMSFGKKSTSIVEASTSASWN